ncbi:MAG: hypothetical protein IT340_22005 [Chloroflexi bacterium]|nr:hypothetical protein [Chloroflexota bacterium]
MAGSVPPSRFARRRGLPARWQRRWRDVQRRPVARWLVLAAPVLVVLLALSVLAPTGPTARDLSLAWELTGRVGVVVVTALIGRAMLNHGR